MKMILRSTLAAAAISLAMPAFAFTPIDFQWYANVGKTFEAPVASPLPVPTLPGYIWNAGHFENRPDGRQVAVDGHFVRDDFAEQTARYNASPTGVATITVFDSQGRLLPVLVR